MPQDATREFDFGLGETADAVRDSVRAFARGRIAATTDFDRLAECDAILVCVPTPLGRHREPDLSFIRVTGDEVAQRLLSLGIPESVMYERSLLGITAMEKAIGKKKFTEALDDLIVKPEGKPTLVPEGDKRPALNSVAKAVADFS